MWGVLQVGCNYEVIQRQTDNLRISGGPTNQINEALGVPHIEVLQLSEKSSETTIHTCWCFTS